MRWKELGPVQHATDAMVFPFLCNIFHGIIFSDSLGICSTAANTVVFFLIRYFLK